MMALWKLLVLGLAVMPLAYAQEVEEAKDAEEASEEAAVPSIPEGPQNGPTLFYDNKNFLLRVTQGVKVHVFSKGSENGNKTTGDTVGKSR